MSAVRSESSGSITMRSLRSPIINVNDALKLDERTATALPEIKRTELTVDTIKPLPTSLQSDFLPEEILMALIQRVPSKDQLEPPPRFRKLNQTVAVPAMKKPDNVWNYPKRRDKLKHLINNTPCICGAGKDISFLYDVPHEHTALPKVAPHDASGIRAEVGKEGKTEKETMKLPDSLLPEEYYIVKNKQVMNLEYTDDKYGSQPSDHEKHLVVFPSMKPVSRYEVIKLQNAMDDMLNKAGLTDIDGDLKGPTQMHNLLQLIKKEQDIYNVIFHELIRQVSVECIERGELLANVREKYSDLLNRIPNQVKSLHEEVLAQRSLDRRLTEELLKFKSTIMTLTDELSDVKEHDAIVAKQALQAQEELKAALSESQKNANLLAEYHSLYELQRHRLESQVTALTNERELWSGAALSLALKVIEENDLNVANQLHIHGKMWAKLAKHFTLMLADCDTKQLLGVQENVDRWNDQLQAVDTLLKQREEQLKCELSGIVDEMERCYKDSQRPNTRMTHSARSRTTSSLRTPVDYDKIARLIETLKSWDEKLNRHNEKFTGEYMLNIEDELDRVRQRLSSWTDLSLKIFARHQLGEDQHLPQHDEMSTVNEQVMELLKQYRTRVTGDNGVATSLIHLTTHIDSWHVRLKRAEAGGAMTNEDWTNFYQVLEDWINATRETITLIGETQNDLDRSLGKPNVRIDPYETAKRLKKWASDMCNQVDNEDAKQTECAAVLHSEMTRWMIEILLRLAPNKPNLSEEGHKTMLLARVPIGQLTSTAKSLINRLNVLTEQIISCSKGIVLLELQKKQQAGHEDAELEKQNLQKFKTEADEWSRMAIEALEKLGLEQTKAELNEEDTIISENSTDLIKLRKQKSQTDLPSHAGDTLNVKIPLRSASTSNIGDRTSTVDALFSPVSTAASVQIITKTVDQNKTTEVEKEETTVENEIIVSNELSNPPSTSTTPTKEPDILQSESNSPQISNELQKPKSSKNRNLTPNFDKDTQKSAKSKEYTISREVTRASSIPHSSDIQIEVLSPNFVNTQLQLLEEAEAAVAVEAQQDIVVPAIDRPGTPNTQKGFAALAAVETLQKQLLTAEKRALDAEEHALNIENELQRAMEKLANMERALAQANADLTSIATDGANSHATVTASDGNIHQTQDKEYDTRSEKR